MSKRNRDEIIGRYGGGAFDNFRKTVWRCRKCGGLYLTDGSWDHSVRMGVIIEPRGGRLDREHETRLVTIYRSGPHCECEDLADRAAGNLLMNPWLPFPGFEWLLNDSWNVEESSEDDL